MNSKDFIAIVLILGALCIGLVCGDKIGYQRGHRADKTMSEILGCADGYSRPMACEPLPNIEITNTPNGRLKVCTQKVNSVKEDCVNEPMEIDIKANTVGTYQQAPRQSIKPREETPCKESKPVAPHTKWNHHGDWATWVDCGESKAPKQYFCSDCTDSKLCTTGGCK